MVEQILEGVERAPHRLLIFGVGYFLFWAAKSYVTGFGGESSPVPKWKVALIVPAVAVILGSLATVPSGVTEGGDMLFGYDMADVIDVEKPYRAITSVFIFTCVVMWIGVGVADRD